MGCTSDKMVAPTMTDMEKKSVKDTWSHIAGKKDFGDVGLVMFNKLFQDNSSLRSLYSFLRDETANDDANSKLRSHGKGVMEVVDLAVSSIDNLKDLHPVVVDLGCRHYKYGVKKSHLQKEITQGLLRSLFFDPIRQSRWSSMAIIGCRIFNFSTTNHRKIRHRDQRATPMIREIKFNAPDTHVSKRHFLREPVGKSLIYTLDTNLADKFTNDVRSSWLKFFGVLSVGFSEGLDKAEKLSKKGG